MRILVTGGAGFIGSQIVEALVDAGHQVRVFDALIPGVHPPGQQPQLPDGAEFVHGDVRDEDAVAKALRGIDLVSHQAAMVGRGHEILDAPRYASCNDLGTAVLVAAMTRIGIHRLVLGSSVVIYGDSRYECAEHGRVRPPRRSAADLEQGRFEPRCPDCGAEVVASPVVEDDTLDPPRNVYAVTKLAQEYLVAAWVRETGACAAALRYHNVYGPNMPYNSPYSGVAAVFRSSVARHVPPRVFEDGGPLRDFIHVRDVAQANIAALGWPGQGFRAFNVATGQPRSVGQLAAVLAEAAGTPPPQVTGEYRIGDVRHIFASPRRLISELGWKPAVEFETGIRQFAMAPMRGPEMTRPTGTCLRSAGKAGEIAGAMQFDDFAEDLGQQRADILPAQKLRPVRGGSQPPARQPDADRGHQEHGGPGEMRGGAVPLALVLMEVVQSPQVADEHPAGGDVGFQPLQHGADVTEVMNRVEAHDEVGGAQRAVGPEIRPDEPDPGTVDPLRGLVERVLRDVRRDDFGHRGQPAHHRGEFPGTAGDFDYLSRVPRVALQHQSDLHFLRAEVIAENRVALDFLAVPESSGPVVPPFRGKGPDQYMSCANHSFSDHARIVRHASRRWLEPGSISGRHRSYSYGTTWAWTSRRSDR